MGSKKIAYITSMVTGGLAGFNYKEVVELLRLGVGLELFITKHRPGPYMPPPGVTVHALTTGSVLRDLLSGILAFPRATLGLVGEAIRMKTVGDLAAALGWAPRMRAAKCDRIHCHWGDHKLYIGYYCHRLLGIPLSVTLHGYDLYAPPNWPMLERCLRACTPIITISDYNRRLLIKRFGNLGERVKVVRLFTDSTADPSELSRCIKILIVAGFQDRKGYDVLLKALRQLGRPDLRLWVVGYKGPVDVPGLVSELGLQAQVTIFGAVSDDVLKILYSYCDIFCMPSRMDKLGIGEGLPVSLMEAMSYEKPVVSTVHTGIPELVPDILVPENDVAGLAAGLARLADDAALRSEMGRRNRKIVAAQYSQENVTRLVEAWDESISPRS